ncbi:MAG: sigma-70 family RNA polymerase sigma factor [Clostridiales bacterium]|nr:sigma-70 family RNA polymerase sigma factor [Clostridiales bacterium]
MEDEKIVDLFWQRSELAIARAESRYSRYLYSISYRILQNREDAEECVNETFLRAWNAIPPARPSILRTYLGRITRNISLNYLEKMNALKRGGNQVDIILSELEECIPSIQMDIEEILNERAVIDVINNFLKGLSKDQRKVFVRRYWYGSKIKAIGKDYGFTESKVKSILFRLRKGLKRKLEKEGIAL